MQGGPFDSKAHSLKWRCFDPDLCKYKILEHAHLVCKFAFKLCASITVVIEYAHSKIYTKMR